MKNSIILLVLLLFLYSPNAEGQETGAKKFENPEWFEIVQVKYKPGAKQKAKELIKEHFMATGMEAGIPGPHLILDLVSGEWDMLYIWKLEEGIGTLDYEITPEGAKFREAFLKKVGSQQRAEEIWSEYDSYVQDWKVEFARKWE